MGTKAERTAKPAAAAMPAAGRSRASVRKSPPVPRARAAVRPTPIRATRAEAPFTRRAVFEELESRLLMSADLNPLTHETLLAAPALQGAEFRALADDGSAVTKTAVAAVQRTNEIVFVDPRVPDRERLLAGLTAQSDGRRFEVIELNAGRDGIAQVTAALRGRIQVDAVHFITHGADAAVQLGGTWLDAKTLAANADAVAGWGDSLKQDADLLFYGCDLASSARGRALVEWLADLTKADVAASTDATGHGDLGGDWELEYNSGEVATATPIAEAATSWLGLLGVPIVQYDPGFAALDDASYELKDTQPWGQSFQHDSGSGTYAVNKVEVVLSRASDAAPQTITVSLQDFWNGAPLASATIASSALGTNEAWYSFDLGSVTLNDNQQYYIRVDTDGIEKIYLGVDSSGTAPNGDLINFAGVAESGKDAAFRVIAPNAVPTGSPTITGTTQEDQTLTANTSTVFDADGLGIFAYQWARSSDGGSSWTNILGATSQNYTLGDADVGKLVRVSVAYVDGGGTPEVVTSAGVGPVLGVPDDTLIVDTTSDVSDGDTSSIDALLANKGSDGFVSLREAIIATNSTANASGSDQILFDIAGVGPHTILLTSALPAIIDVVIIDGSSEPDFLGTPIIELNGAGMSGGITLQSGSSGSVVRGFVINRFGGSGLLIAGGSYGNTIADNWIGTDAFGTADQGNNGEGILIDGDDNIVTGNVISGNNSDGIQINGGATGNRVIGNLIGTNRFGDLALGNTGAGINIFGGGNTVGGTMAGERNVISGNFQGISISTAQAVGNIVQGNYIGTDVTGAQDRGNTSDGVRIFDGARGTVIGGTASGARNVISGNTVNGVELNGAGTTGNIVAGNTIGLNAAGDTAVANGLSGVMLIDASGNTIGVAGAGNVLSGNVQDGITGFRSNGNLIEGNYIGTDATGSFRRGNVEDGIYFEDSSNNTIGGTTPAARNVVSANGWSGITLWGTGSGNLVQGNYIGTDAAGGTPLGNGEQGVLVVTSGPTTIGGAAAGAGNLIAYNGSSGAGWDGIAIMAGAAHSVIGNTIHSNSGDGLHVEGSDTIIAGNYIGTDASGAAGLGNSAYGVHLASDFNRVGGTGVGEGNVIAGSGIDGIFIDASNNNVIQGNYIGTNPTGTAAIGNAEDGIWLNDASDNLIGGATATARNVISGNQWSGVAFSGAGANNVVQGNLIGVDATGTGPLGNGRHGVDIGGSVDTTVEANVIANNGWDGVSITSGTGHTISGNATYSNAGLGIDIGNDGVTLNDADDVDLGTNLGMNTPEIYSVVVSGGTVTVTGEARAGATVQFFEAAVDPSGAGEGASFLHEGVVSGATPGAVDSTARQFSFTFAAGALAVGDQLTATAIDASGNTSEFSFNELAAPPNTPPVANDASSNGNEDDPSITLTLTGADLEGPIASFRVVGALPASGLLYTDAGLTMLAAPGTDYAAAGNALTLYFVPAANWSGVTGFQFTATDAGGLSDATPATATIVVAPVNDTPAAVADAAATNENTPVTTGDVLFNDALGDQPTTIVAFDAVSAQGGAVVLGAGNAFTYTPATTFSGIDTFTYTIGDGDGETSTATVTVTVANVANDAPVNIVPGAQIIAEDVAIVFSTGNGNRIAVSDPDAGVNPLQVTLTATNGTLTLAGTAGLVFLAGDGTADAAMTITGTQAALNAALDGMSFLPTLNFTGAASVAITTDDLGASGVGGPLSDIDSVNITVNAVDDAPTLDLDLDDSSGAINADYVRTFTENAGSRLIADAVDATLFDTDSANLASLTVTITNLIDGPAESLSADTTGTLITATYNPASGVLTLNGADTVAHYQQVLRTVRYNNTSEAPTTTARVITFIASDGGSPSNVGTATVTVNAVNDAPTATMTAASYAATENMTLDLHGTGMSVADIDALSTSIVTVQLDATSGLLSATAGTTGVVVAGSGSPVLTLTGTLAQVNALLTGGGGGTVTYLVGSDSPFPTDTLNLSINDNGATGAGGALWGWESRTMNLTAVNDAPLITIPGTATTPEDATLVFSAGFGNQISITDVDAGGAPVQVTLNVSNGLVSLAGIAGLTFTVGDGAADASMTFTGTVASINAALNGLAFAPTADFNGSAFLSVSVNDQGNSGSGGALSDADFCTITVSAANDLPAGADNTASLPQDTARVFAVADFGFTDTDAGDALSGVRIDTLSLLPGATLMLGAASVIAGQVIDVADINAGTLVFTPALGASGSPYASFTFSVRDGAGAFDAAPNAMTLNVASAANNAPAGTNNTVTTFASTNRVFTVADFGFSDPDAGDALSAVWIDTLPSALLGTLLLGVAPVLPGQIVLVGDIAAGNLVFAPLPLLTGTTSFTFSVQDTNGPAFDAMPRTMTVSVIPVSNVPVNTLAGLPSATEDTATAIGGIVVNDPNGNLTSVQLSVASGTLGATAAGAAAVAGSGTTSLTITGTQADINATLASLGYQGTPDFAGVDTLTITSTDASALQDVDSVALAVGAVNDAPVAAALPNYAATEQVVLALAGTGLAVSDVDAGASSVTVTLSAITGALVVGGGAGVAVSGSGTPSVTLTGLVSDINALLAGGSVNYFVTTDSPPATDTLTLAINDGGASGAGGPRSASVSATITIGAANDAPVNTLPGGATTLEDTPVIYSAAGGNQISITDVDAGGAPVQATLNVANGVVTLGGVGGLTFTAGDGTADSNMTFTGTVASINTALDGLVFTPNLNYNGLAFITLTTNDLGASGSEVPVTPRSDTDLATIDVLPVNDAPDGTDTTVTALEDSTYTFTLGNFGFNDVDFGDAMTEVRIDSVTLPAGATLQLAGAPVTAGLVITAADINAGNLVFTPVANANGAGYASFTFSVRDTGVPPGPLFDPVRNTMTIDVAPVNDLPVITSDGGLAAAALTVVENTTGVTTMTATDIDLQPLTFSIAGGLDAVRFSINATTGVLTFNPAPNFEAPADSGANNVYDLVVRVEDGAGGSDTQALSITVTDTNDPPFVTGDAYTTVEETPLSIVAPGALANDGDEDLDPIAATLVAGPANGAVAFNADGSFVYTPNANFAGVDSFTYHVSDGAVVSADATITILVSPVNDAPTAGNGNFLSTPAVAYAFTLADFNYSDVDGDPLDHVQITALPTVGALTLGGAAVTLNQIIDAADIAAGNLQYVAPTGTVAADSFGFLVHDGAVYAGVGSTMTVGFIVPPAPPPAPSPVAGPPPAPPSPPAPPPAPAPDGGPGTGSGTPPPATGGSHGGTGGGAAGTAPTPIFAESAPAAAESVAAPAAAAVTAAPIASLAGPSGGVSASSGGLQTDTRSLGSVESLQARGELAEVEVKAAMQEIAVMRDQEFRQELNKLREEVQQEAVVETRVAASVFAVSTGLSVGYVLWLLRGGVLLASLLSSIPAWRLLDPLPVLGRVGGQSDEDDESLEDMVDNQPDSAAAGTDDETPVPRGAMRVLQAFRRSAT